jgi:hypothetical protein
VPPSIDFTHFRPDNKTFLIGTQFIGDVVAVQASLQDKWRCTWIYSVVVLGN